LDNIGPGVNPRDQSAAWIGATPWPDETKSSETSSSDQSAAPNMHDDPQPLSADLTPAYGSLAVPLRTEPMSG
jgi:hypothetical protein